MSLKDNDIKSSQNNLINFPKNIKKKINFNKKLNDNTINTLKYIKLQKKDYLNKRSPNFIHDNHSSSSINIYSRNKNKNSLSTNKINIKASSILNKSHKDIGDKNIYTKNNKSQIDINKVFIKTNLNNNNNNEKIIFNSMNNSNKNKDNKSISSFLNSFSLYTKNANSGLFRKKILSRNDHSGYNNNQSNSMMTILKGYKIYNSYSNIFSTFNNNKINLLNNKNDNFKDLEKEKKRLSIIFNEKIIDSQKIDDKIKELENKNKILEEKIDKIKNENDNLYTTINKIKKFIKIMKNKGYDIDNIINNISYYDIEDSNDEKEDNKDINFQQIILYKDFSFKNRENVQQLINTVESLKNSKKLIIKNILKKKFNMSNKCNNKKEENNIENIKIKLNEEFSFKSNKNSFESYNE